MRIVVTGCHGYIGSVLTPLLQAAGHTVFGIDSNLFAGSVLGAPPPQIPHRQLDLRDVQPDDLEGFDAVIHLASLSNDPMCNLVPELTHQINYVGSVRLARVAKEAGVPRFIHSSSCS